MKVTPFLMFQGAAEEALAFYVSVLPGSRIDSIERYGPGEPKPEGAFKLGRATLAGTPVVVLDSPVPHAFTFTPATSLYVDVDTREQLESIAAALGEGGTALMPLGDYGFSRGFAWVQDRWGVSWQINLA